jgi:hypothetical protein
MGVSIANQIFGGKMLGVGLRSSTASTSFYQHGSHTAIPAHQQILSLRVSDLSGLSIGLTMALELS